MTAGVRQIVRFNWPMYAIGAVAVTVAFAAGRAPLGVTVRGLAVAAAGLTTFWLVASLAASWLVYDRSRLTRWHWIPGALGVTPATWVNVHAGLDQSTPALRALFPASSGRVFDIFDPAEMTEPSIRRARTPAGTIAAERVDYRRLPAAAGAIGAAFLLMSAHELRTEGGRATLFRELARILAQGGRVVVAEHLRDAPNFAAFGPGFLHFHSRATWLRAFATGDFVVEREFAITPFVRVFVLKATGAPCS